MSWKFNPNLKEFLDNNPKMSLIGFTWATYWRLMVIVLVIELAIVLAIALLTFLFSGIFH